MSVEDHRDDWDGPVPVPNGVDEAYWNALLRGTLLYQRCDSCGHAQLYPRVLCTACGALEPPYVESEATGTVYTYTVCYVPGEPGFADRTPYVVATIELTEGPRLLALVDATPGNIDVGDAVEATFWRISEDAAIPVFVPE